MCIAEGAKLPQETESVLSLLVDSFSVAFQIQSVVQVNTQVSVVHDERHTHLKTQGYTQESRIESTLTSVFSTAEQR